MPLVFGAPGAPTQDRFAGTGANVERLSREMMDSWLGSIAPWSQYDDEGRPAMVFGTSASGQQNDPFGEVRSAIEALM